MTHSKLILGDSVEVIKSIPDNSIHAIISDIPYGIGHADWDILHNNTNSAFCGSSDAQIKAGSLFKRRGKPLNGWSEADKRIPVEYQIWCSSWAKDWLRVLFPGASCFIFAGRRLSHRCVCALEDCGFILKDVLAWQKNNAPQRAQRLSAVFSRRKDTSNEVKWASWRLANLRPIFEPILWFQKPYKIGTTLADNVLSYEVGAWNEVANSEYNISYPTSSNIIRVRTDSHDRGLHTAQKPIKLMEFLISLVTIEQQIVLDPFMGSGTTCVAAKKLNRRYIGIDINNQNIEITNKRLENYE